MSSIYGVTKTAEQYRKGSRQHEQNAADSFERCDTDGFLSQWASQQNARIEDALADLAERDCIATVVFLCDEQGNKVNARPIATKYGTSWGVRDESGKIVKFVAYRPARKSTLAKHGYQELELECKCVVKVSGDGYNLNVRFYPEEWLS